MKNHIANWSMSKTTMVGLLLATLVMFVVLQQRLNDYYQVDFSAYWSAGRALNEGEYRYSYKTVDSEGNLFGHAMFLNPPVIAQPFRIIGAFPFHVAKNIWHYTQIFLFAASVWLLGRNNQERVTTLAITVIGMPFVFWPLWAELERGETNMLLLIVTAGSYYLWRKGKITAAGALIGAGSAFKFPLLLIFAIPFALKQRRFIFAGLAVFIAIFAVSLVVDGTKINRDYFVEYLPIIAFHDELPDHVYTHSDTFKPPTTKWEGRTYIVRYKFMAPSGSAARFFRSWSGNRLDRSLIVGGAAITAGALLIGALRRKEAGLKRGERRLWEDMAWSVVVMATLILHTLSWITNYVFFIFAAMLLWRFTSSRFGQPIARLLKYSLLLGTLAIVIGDPLLAWVPDFSEGINIVIRNRVWLGGLLIWGTLLIFIVEPKLLKQSITNKSFQQT